MGNIVYVGMSLDGFFADRNGGLEWLQMIPNPQGDDLGWASFMDRIDAMVMGRKTFETVLSFGVDWPYEVPVFVWSRGAVEIPSGLAGKAQVIGGVPADVIGKLGDRGYKELYIDGGTTVRAFLGEDLIDEMIITRIPVLLGGGVPLFGDLPEHREFTHESTKVLLGEMVMSRYLRKR